MNLVILRPGFIGILLAYAKFFSIVCLVSYQTNWTPVWGKVDNRYPNLCLELSFGVRFSFLVPPNYVQDVNMGISGSSTRYIVVVHAVLVHIYGGRCQLSRLSGVGGRF